MPQRRRRAAQLEGAGFMDVMRKIGNAGKSVIKTARDGKIATRLLDAADGLGVRNALENNSFGRSALKGLEYAKSKGFGKPRRRRAAPRRAPRRAIKGGAKTVIRK